MASFLFVHAEIGDFHFLIRRSPPIVWLTKTSVALLLISPARLPKTYFCRNSDILQSHNARLLLIFFFLTVLSIQLKLVLSATMKPTLVEVVSPWHVFDKLWTLASGYPAQNFHLTPEGKFMTTFGETTTATILYYMTIFLGHEYMHNRQAFQLNDLFQLHNLVLVISSAALLSLFLEQLLPTIWIHGLYYSICGPGGWTDQLVILYYVRRNIVN